MKAMRLLIIAALLATMSFGCGHAAYTTKASQTKKQGAPSGTTQEDPWDEGMEEIG